MNAMSFYRQSIGSELKSHQKWLKFVVTLVILICNIAGASGAGSKSGAEEETLQETGNFNHQTGVNITETLIVDGFVRKSIVHLPASYQTEQSLPLVIVLHGARLSAKIAELVTEFDKLSNDKGFIVVYPNAIHRQWNDGRRREDNPSSGVDDVKFITQLMDYLVWKYHINPKKIYVAGYSSGGMLTQKLGMEATDRFAALAEVASSLPLSQMALNKKPSKPIPVLMINGTNDPAFPWAGGNTSIIGIKVGPVTSVMKSVQYWINVNGGITGAPDEQRVVSDKKGKTTVYRTHFSTKMNMPVILYKINGGGHTWPGSDVPLRYIPLLGRQSKELNGSELIWEFFNNY